MLICQRSKKIWHRRSKNLEELNQQSKLREELYRVMSVAFLDPPEQKLLQFLDENYPFLFEKNGNS